MSFEWQTEDREWDEREQHQRGARPADLPPLDEHLFTGLAAETAAPDARPRNWRRRLLFLGLAGILAMSLFAIVTWQVTARTRTAEARAKADVLASQETILEAARAGDGELFVSFLSGRDPAWARNQEVLARTGGLLDRSHWDLTWDPDPGDITPTVTLAPDLRSAELVAPQRYVVDVGNGILGSVTLNHTSVFRLGPDRWLLAPPSDEFWGETREAGGRYLRVRYPARDTATAERLARDLDATLAQLCRNATAACLELGPLDLTLSTDLTSLVVSADPRSAWGGGSALTMPAPTLFGTPVDEAGYRAVFRAYASRIASAAAANLSGWACCNDVLFYGALRDALLAQLGLRVWPIGPADYEQLVNRPESLGDIERLWRREQATADERRSLYTMIDFLVARSDSTILDMQRLLLDGAERDYWGWINQATGGAYGSQADFERDLLRYAAERRASVSPSPPEQDLQLVYRGPGGADVALYRHNVARDDLAGELVLATRVKPMPVPMPARDGAGALKEPNLATGGYIRHVAPEEDYTIPLLFPDLAGSAAVWVN